MINICMIKACEKMFSISCFSLLFRIIISLLCLIAIVSTIVLCFYDIIKNAKKRNKGKKVKNKKEAIRYLIKRCYIRLYALFVLLLLFLTIYILVLMFLNGGV